MNTQVPVAVEHATEDVAWIRGHQEGSLPGLLGFEWSYLRQGEIGGRFEVQKHHLSPTGFLHAATVVALADTACGYGCLHMLPEQATGFTTAELKTNFLGTAREGFVSCAARLVHGGRTTQVWDAEVKVERSDKTIALFRCTQILLYAVGSRCTRAATIEEFG